MSTTTGLDDIVQTPPSQPERTAPRQLDLGVAVLGLIAATLIVFRIGGPAQAVVGLSAWLLLPGWALVRHLPRLEPAARLALTVVASATVTALIGLAMVWSELWYPQPVAIVLLIVAAASVMALPRARAVVESSERPARHAVTSHGGTSRRSRGRWAWIALVVAVVLWGVSLALTDTSSLGNWGLLTAFPPTFYVALALTLAVALAGIVRARRPGVRAPVARLVASVTVLTVMLYGSANLVESAPRLPWAYKHMAVTALVDSSGRVDPSIDIYNRWPGFFSLSAFSGHVIGVTDPERYAAYAEVGFALVDVLLVLAIARAVSKNGAFAWIAALVFTVSNWVGQNYYAPQAFAYTLYLGVVLIALTTLWNPERSLPRLLQRVLPTPLQPRAMRTWLTEAPVLPVVSPAARRLRLIGIVSIFAVQFVIVASHQLTPYIAVLALLPLFALGYFRPFWVAIGLGVITLAYLAPNLDYVQSHFGLFSSFDPVSNATYTPTIAEKTSAAGELQSRGVLVLTALVVLLALAGFVRRLWHRRVRTTLMVGWLAVAPVLTLAGQSYGGEGRFRVFLFGLPFFAMGVAWLFTSRSRSEKRAASTSWRRLWSFGAVTAVTLVAALFVGTYYQPERDLQTTASDVTAGRWIDQNVEPGSALILSGTTFPFLLDKDYPKFIDGQVSVSSLVTALSYKPSGIDTADIQELIFSLPSYDPAYLVFSDSMTTYAEGHGLFTAEELGRLERGIASTPGVREVYDTGGVRIYQYG
ncbi:hypothetical protein ACPEEZ_14375 [Frigoribacterium sp. 2-23]|uniref:hypothetical protein n=1 Tax=Frigoribacterium sp. 2-23 TaxID=3415006 RepID=UPI003C6EF16A